MEENEKINPEYLKGFNEGYSISKNLPELAEQFKSIEGNSHRLQGYKDGQTQYQLERRKELFPSWLKSDQQILKEKTKKEKSKEIDKDLGE
ncbi:hypothetical protein [Ferruginibacter sp. HRS2-29]|uniref:hypothetical protein n=1 Tax=Ferruginibacter sp. HRS2-29 TaxID=2487334 RepID=UPI0020CBF2A8|nr:hypothetical protein [Ferruginibacter sp. HRS2-29]MCP9750000.1 hypothetical protein [Ferruginibacter sp. HRS2-29]